MSGTVRRRQDFSDIDNLDRATEAFLREQRKALEERKFVRAPRTAPLWIQSHWKKAAATAALVLVGGIAVFAGIRVSANGRALRQPEPETTITAEAPVTSAEQTEEQQGSAEESASKQSEAATKKKAAATTTARQTEKSSEAEQTAVPTSESSSATRRTESVSSSESSTGTSKSTESAQQRPAVTTTQRGSSGIKVVTNQTTTRTTARVSSQTTATTRTSTTSTSRTTASTARTTATTKQTTVTTTSTTPVVTEAPRAVLNVSSVKISDLKEVSSGYQQRISVTISNKSSFKFNDLRTVYVQLSRDATQVYCTSGNATVNVQQGDTISFYFSDTLRGNATATVSLLVVSKKPIIEASSLIG